MKGWPALISGILFGLGLTLSGMSDPAKVLGFLNVTGAWVPDLIFVMGGAVVVTLVLTPLVLKRAAPLLASTFSLPTKADSRSPPSRGRCALRHWLGALGLLPRSGPGQLTLWLPDHPRILPGDVCGHVSREPHQSLSTESLQ